MGLDLYLYRVVKDTEKANEPHIMEEHEKEIMKTHFPSNVFEIGDYRDESGYLMKNAGKVLVMPKEYMRFGILNDNISGFQTYLQAERYVFDWETVEKIYNDCFPKESHQKEKFFHNFLQKFKEGKDFLYFDH